MPHMKVNLLDEEGRLKETIEVDSDRSYTLNSYFETPDGDLWLVCEVALGDEKFDSELSCIWVGRPE
jgi:hypothetical protein